MSSIDRLYYGYSIAAIIISVPLSYLFALAGESRSVWIWSMIGVM